MVALHPAIAIIAIVALIIRFKVDPVISLIIGSLYLGLASGVGFEKTVEAITGGFGEIMAKVGLLIGFGVLIGSLLHAMGTFRKLVGTLINTFGAKRMPYAMTTAMSTIFPSIYVDVQVVLAAPVARSAAPFIGARGLPHLAGGIGAGIFAGYVFMIPGLAAISICALLDIKLGSWLMYGVVLGPLTAILTTMIFGVLLRFGWWSAERDEEYDEAVAEIEAHTLPAGGDVQSVTASGESPSKPTPPLGIALLPILVPLVMIAFGAFAEVLDMTNPFIDFLGNATVALFVGLLGAFLLARRYLRESGTSEALSEGFHTTGEILLITGIGGSLGQVIKATGLDDQLAGLFTADAGAPIIVSILLAWVVAAVLHIAIGSVSVAAITAGGIIGPVLPSIAVNPIAIGLAIASGALFALHVNSNFFWMFKSLLGLSTTGALKSLTTVTTIASLVSLPVVVALGLVI